MEILNDQQLMNNTPSVFATAPKGDVSTKYMFIPTTKVIESLAKKEWYPVRAKQSMVRLADNKEFTKHQVNFRTEVTGFPAKINECVPEIILTNSHDRTACFELMAGLYRLVCLNGLVVGTSFSSVYIKHIGFDTSQVYDAVDTIGEQFFEISNLAYDMQKIKLTHEQRISFAYVSARFRWGDDKVPVEPGELLIPRRLADDETDLWRTYNVVQENLIKGGLHGHTVSYQGNRSRRFTTRDITNIQLDQDINQKLWSMSMEILKARQN